MRSDIEIAQLSTPQPITQIAESVGINSEHVEQYGKYKAKINHKVFDDVREKNDGKLVLVTAINPTPAGEGKTTTTIGLSQALNKLGTKSIVALREPSLGPCMGVKGGATGGGYSQVVPMEEINLHFTGDLHAISTAHNLLSTMVDNHVHQGNELNIDVRTIVWTRVMDMNDRALRSIVVGLGGKANGFPREDGFIITVASEVMAILCLSENLEDLKERLGRIIVAYNKEGLPVTCKDIGANGAMTALLKDAIKPNLVQTLENTPALIHGGPFANIAHGCNSIIATKLALKLADVIVTEAGFGSDLGAEKFFDIKCRKANLKPDAVVLVATIRALKYNGKVLKKDLSLENTEAVKNGMVNLQRHIENLKKFGVPIVVTLNQFTTDTEAEINVVSGMCAEQGVLFELSQVWEKGGEGGINLAKKVLEALQQPSDFRCLYDENLPVKEKLSIISTEIYRAKGVSYSPKALKDIEKINRLGYDKMPICIAKTQYSFSGDATLLGAPENFDTIVNEIKISAGAGFLVAITGDIMTMPGLPKKPAAINIDVNSDGEIVGLF